MKQIKLTQGKVALVNDEDFDYLNQWKWHIVNGYAGKNNKDRSITKMHRLIMNCPKNKQIDHIDGNKINNQRINLRICTNIENSRNSKIHKDNKSGYKGVTFVSLKYKSKKYNYWKAQIEIMNKNICLGYFKNKENAAIAYNNAAKKYFIDFARLNMV